MTISSREWADSLRHGHFCQCDNPDCSCGGRCANWVRVDLKRTEWQDKYLAPDIEVCELCAMDGIGQGVYQ